MISRNQTKLTVHRSGSIDISAGLNTSMHIGKDGDVSTGEDASKTKTRRSGKSKMGKGKSAKLRNGTPKTDSRREAVGCLLLVTREL